MKDIDLSKSMSKFVDCPYALGDIGKGYDCLSFIGYLYYSLGFNFPLEYKGITIENYADLWRSGEGRKEFKEFLLSLGESVKHHNVRRGDIVVFQTKDGAAPGVYTGNGNLHIITEKGGRTIPLNYLKNFGYELIDIRRLL